MTLHAHGATRIVTESFCVHEQMFKCMCYVCVYACVRLSVLVDSVRGQGEVCGGKATLVASRSFISREAECPFGRSRLSLSHPDQVSVQPQHLGLEAQVAVLASAAVAGVAFMACRFSCRHSAKLFFSNAVCLFYLFVYLPCAPPCRRE